MDNKETFSWGWVIFIILILWFFAGGNGFGFGGYNRNGACGLANCDGTSNCEVERQGLITAAETNFRIIEENRKSTDMISSQLRAQFDAVQGEKIFDLKLNNLAQQNAYNLALSEKNATIERMTLANSLNARFDALGNQIQNIQCSMLKKPELSGLATSCNPIISPLLATGYYNGYFNGFGNYNNGCNGFNSNNLA